MNNFSKLDLKRRQRFLKNELTILKWKSLSQDLSLPKKIRLQARMKLNSLTSFSKHKIKHRCIVTARGKSIYKQLGVSRIILRDLGHLGLLPGVSKASW